MTAVPGAPGVPGRLLLSSFARRTGGGGSKRAADMGVLLAFIADSGGSGQQETPGRTAGPSPIIKLGCGRCQTSVSAHESLEILPQSGRFQDRFSGPVPT